MIVGKYDSYENVYDFVEFKLHRTIEDLAREGLDDMAYKVADVLDMYLSGECDIEFKSGVAYYYLREEEKDEQ